MLSWNCTARGCLNQVKTTHRVYENRVYDAELNNVPPKKRFLLKAGETAALISNAMNRDIKRARIRRKFEAYHQSCLHVASEWILGGRMILSVRLMEALYTMRPSAGVSASFSLGTFIVGVKSVD